MRRNRGIASVSLCLTAFAAGRAQMPQMGLRLDAMASMQWTGRILMTEATTRSYVKLKVDSIQDVWPGPARGAFAVVSPAGLSMLYGHSVLPAGVMVEAGELLRSSRPDVAWSCTSNVAGKPHRRIVELRAGGRVRREVVTFDREVVDFDVDALGHVVALLDDGSLAIGSGSTPKTIDRAMISRLTMNRRVRRVFVDALGKELAIYADGLLVRLIIATGQTERIDVDVDRDALVRHAVTRRIHVEQRWDIE